MADLTESGTLERPDDAGKGKSGVVKSDEPVALNADVKPSGCAGRAIPPGPEGPGFSREILVARFL